MAVKGGKRVMFNQPQDLFGNLVDHTRFEFKGGKYIKIPQMSIVGHDWDFVYNCIKENNQATKFFPPEHTIDYFCDDTTVILLC